MREVVQNQREHPKILIKYVAVHPTVVSENYSSSGEFWQKPNSMYIKYIFCWQIYTYYIQKDQITHCQNRQHFNT